jgi:hypothetical protein
LDLVVAKGGIDVGVANLSYYQCLGQWQ